MAEVERDRTLGVGPVTYGPQAWQTGVSPTPPSTPDWFEYPIARRPSEILGLPVLLGEVAGTGGTKVVQEAVYSDHGIAADSTTSARAR